MLVTIPPPETTAIDFPHKPMAFVLYPQVRRSPTRTYPDTVDLVVLEQHAVLPVG